MILFNHHKLKKKWGRKIRAVSKVMSTDTVPQSQLKDFAWHKSKTNPLWAVNGEPRLRFRWSIGILIFCLIITVLILVFHPFFLITKINVFGVERLSNESINDSALSSINYKKLLVFPANNYFLLNLNDVKDLIKDKFNPESIVIRKEFPNIISIQIQEKLTQTIYDNGKQYSFIDNEGKVIELLRNVGTDEWQGSSIPSLVKNTTSSSSTATIPVTLPANTGKTHQPDYLSLTAKYGNYPIVYDSSGVEAKLGSQVIKENLLSGINKWYILLQKNINLKILYFSILDQLGGATVKLSGGQTLAIKLTEVDEQFKDLQYLLKNKIDQQKFNYIDLRFKSRVYWK